ncbi:LysR substrate-binding domain-containing protein [Cocleimonas sp. KMM 6892]|uniref:LysR substrate-binding domain-containing protein n=1 Tax=unclassified Cocleimonas TaxID=2639732 RepID=UPI002DBED6CB|nr:MULTISPECIES: LysR substrate-binding domain-containing protein [unclassified Cocleimonas]MEB8431044.1 LysR substrate-binding domain-containing protein [Cocleimonas sp. KMM 6892]MEC4714184.1 LysR substrate-binding domain-containing protein [Cocleimonas sp. KMM 6895]MEC4743515.1 LysR substrate-binding domain-containing protein [Cocleimonas sp. KMM 6896]
MDIKQLKTLIVTAEVGTFAQAAELIYLTPAAISQQIKNLESEIGVTLFDRTTRPPHINSNGLQMVESAKQIIQIIEETKSTFSGKEVIGTLNIGSVRTSALNLLPRAMMRLKEKYPKLKVKLRVSSSEALLADVIAGRLDAAIIAEHSNISNKIKWSPFLNDPLMVIAPPGSEVLPAKDLLIRHPFIRFSRNVSLSYIIETELAHMGVITDVIAEIDTISAIVSCVAEGLGVAVVPNIALREASHKELVCTSFGEPQTYRQMGLIEQTNSSRQSAILALHDELASMAHPYGVRRK